MTAPQPTADRRPGRPRDARADEAILAAAVSVLADRGPSGFTVDEVASRAGVGKATVYRRWTSRGALLLDTAHQMGLHPPRVDTGTLRGDLVEMLRTLAGKMRGTPAGRILPGVMAEASVDPGMRVVLVEFMEQRRELPLEVLRRGVERGELPADTDLDLVLDALAGPVMYRELMAGKPLADGEIARLVDGVLAGFGGLAPPTEPDPTSAGAAAREA